MSTDVPESTDAGSGELVARRLQPVLEVDSVQRHFVLKGSAPWSRRKGLIRAVDGVSFDLAPQTTLSIVGESGCGKSTLARLILGLDDPTGGEIRFRGEEISHLDRASRKVYRRSVQAVFQDPTSALNGRRTVAQIVGEPVKVNERLGRDALAERVDGLLSEVGLDSALGTAYPGALSGGMRQRVALAQAIALKPAVVVLDEPVSALDVSIRAQIMNLLKDLQEEFGISYVMIAHDLATVRHLSHEVVTMYMGQVVERSSASAMFEGAHHPYTLALISAVGTASSKPARERIVLPGDVGSPIDPPTGCRFHPRCWLRSTLGNPPKCSTEVPILQVAGDGHAVACHFAEELFDDKDRQRHLTLATERSAVTVPAPS